MSNHLFLALTGASLALLAGCGPKPAAAPAEGAGRPVAVVYPDQLDPDAAFQYHSKLAKTVVKGLDFQDATVAQVVAAMRKTFDCRIEITPEARQFIDRSDPRITAGLGEVQAPAAFATCRALLESKGLVLTSKGNAFGSPAFVLGRSIVRDVTGR